MNSFFNHLAVEEMLRENFAYLSLLKELREVGSGFIGYGHDWLIQSVGGMKALVELENCCRDPG